MAQIWDIKVWLGHKYFYAKTGRKIFQVDTMYKEEKRTTLKLVKVKENFFNSAK